MVNKHPARKKSAFIFMLALIIPALVACGSSNNKTTTPLQTTPVATTPAVTTPTKTTPVTTSNPNPSKNVPVTGTWTGTYIENGDGWAAYYNVTFNFTNQTPIQGNPENYRVLFGPEVPINPGDDIADFSETTTFVRSEGNDAVLWGSDPQKSGFPCIVSGSTISWQWENMVTLQVSGNSISGSGTGTLFGYIGRNVRGAYDLKRVN